MAFRVREMTGQPVHVRAAGGAHEDAGSDWPVQQIVLAQCNNQVLLDSDGELCFVLYVFAVGILYVSFFSISATFQL